MKIKWNLCNQNEIKWNQMKSIHSLHFIEIYNFIHCNDWNLYIQLKFMHSLHSLNSLNSIWIFSRVVSHLVSKTLGLHSHWQPNFPFLGTKSISSEETVCQHETNVCLIRLCPFLITHIHIHSLKFAPGAVGAAPHALAVHSAPLPAGEHAHHARRQHQDWWPRARRRALDFCGREPYWDRGTQMSSSCKRGTVHPCVSAAVAAVVERKLEV